MSIQIKLKNSVVQDSTPSTSDLPAVGEIALNANIIALVALCVPVIIVS